MPENYNELSGKQLIEIAGLFVRQLPAEIARLKALKIIMDKTGFSFALVPADAKSRMLEYVDWVFEKNTLTKQLLPKFKGLVGAKEEFENLTLAEFHFAEMFYREMVADNQSDAINKLVAVLYREPKSRYDYVYDSDNDARRKFNTNEIDYHARLIKPWPPKVKMAIVMFYDGAREGLLHLYHEIFQGNKGEQNDDGMFGVMRGLAENGKYGPFWHVEQMNIHTALLELTMLEKEAAKITTPTV